MSSISTVLIYEFFTGGGCPAGPLPRGLAAEALGMLWAALADFRSWGALRTVTALDPRFESLIPGLDRTTLPADEILCATPGKYEEIFCSLLQRCGAALIIAPETDRVLSRLIAGAEKAGVRHLGASAAAAGIAGNKAECGRIFQQAQLPAPLTRESGFPEALAIAQNMGFPLVIKPIDGVGSEGVARLDSPADLTASLTALRKGISHEQILLQSFVQGIPASVSLLVSGEDSLPLCLNRQLMENGHSLKYAGSETPYSHVLGAQALELARAAVGLVSGLQGYVGVDMVLSNGSAQLIEINPRLTTSYIALRKVVNVNLAQAIWEACIEDRLPKYVTMGTPIVIKKDDPETWGLSSSQPEICENRNGCPGKPCKPG